LLAQAMPCCPRLRDRDARATALRDVLAVIVVGMVRLAGLPVAARVERGRTEAALVEEMGADTPHRLGLAGDPDLTVTVRQRRGADRFFEQRTRREPDAGAPGLMEPVER